MPLYPLLCLLEIVIWGEPLWFSAAIGLASLVATPVAAAIAVLRHDLYDVDKALGARRHVGAGHRAAARRLRRPCRRWPGCWSAALPGRRRGRHRGGGAAPAARGARRTPAVDARLYPLRRAALAAVDDLHREVSAGRARPEQLEDVLRDALRDPGLRVGFRVAGSGVLPRRGRASRSPADGVPVRQDDEQTGVLVPGSGPASAELLREVADRCSTLVEVVRLRSEVAQALREAQSSRTRLVEIGYEERRRMERDLHDGAQQRLVSLGMQLRLAQRAPRRRHRRRRRPARRERRRARHRGRRAAPDRARAAAEQPGRRAARPRCPTWSAACR